MKKSILVVLCATFGALLQVGTAPAAFIAYEPFNGNTGSLLGQTNASNGMSWLRAGTSADPTAIKEVTGNLSLTNGMPAPVGNSVALTGIGDGSGAAERLPLGTLVTSGTVYYSFTMRVDNLTGSNNGIGGLFMAFNNTGNASQTTNPSVTPARMQGRIDPTDASKYDIGVFNITATAGSTSWAPALTVGTTHFIVAGYTFNTGSATDDVASLWIDPDPSTFLGGVPPAPTVTGTGGDVASPGIQSLILRQSPAPQMTLDEIRIGTDWTTVTVPEPGACFLLLSSCFFACIPRRCSV
jgi:hypothetical protein